MHKQKYKLNDRDLKHMNRLKIKMKKVLKQMVKYYDIYSTDITVNQYIKTLYDAYALSELIKLPLSDIIFANKLEEHLSREIIDAYYIIKLSEEEYKKYDDDDDDDDDDFYDHADDKYDDTWSEVAAAKATHARGGKSRKRKSRKVTTRKMKQRKSKRRKTTRKR